MKTPKKIQNIIKLRAEYAKKLLHYDCEVITFCEKNNVDISELMNNYGCMLLTEPDIYAQKTIETIEKT